MWHSLITILFIVLAWFNAVTNHASAQTGQSVDQQKLCNTACPGSPDAEDKFLVDAYNMCTTLRKMACLFIAKKGVFYGHYCGYGSSPELPPIDEIDTACQIHDRCYETDLEKKRCECDDELVTTLLALEKNHWTQLQLDTSDKIITLFEPISCKKSSSP